MARARQLWKLGFLYIVIGLLFLGLPMTARAQLGAIGGIGGISGAETNEATPLFTMTGTPSFRAGEGSLNFAYLNTRVTRAFGDKIEDRFGASVAAELVSKVFLVNYGVTDRWSVGAAFQFDTSRVRSATDKVETKDLSNPSFSAKYTMIRNPNISVRGLVKLPTGYEAGSDNPELDLDLAWTASLWGYSDLHLQIGYQYTMDGRSGVNPTDLVIANAALARSFGENFVFFTELLYRRGGGSLDSKNKTAAQKSLDVTPGFKVQFKEKFLFSTAVRIALINDFALGYDYSYLALLGYLF
ncbi:MAG: hypothetical protein HY282_08570 [Nitrospirae bacterium]|nr:hypothetical protein [Candidatus Manganitrophaceae bacterium]